MKSPLILSAIEYLKFKQFIFYDMKFLGFHNVKLTFSHIFKCVANVFFRFSLWKFYFFKISQIFHEIFSNLRCSVKKRSPLLFSAIEHFQYKKFLFNGKKFKLFTIANSYFRSFSNGFPKYYKRMVLCWKEKIWEIWKIKISWWKPKTFLQKKTAKIPNAL